MRIYVLMAHPDRHSFNGHLADSYCAAASQAGHEVRRHNLGELKFDPVLWQGYKAIQELEPDLLAAHDNILWCQHWVILYPIWWGSMPALLKGFFDRALYSGFAYHYHERDPFWDKLLKGRSGHLVTTSDAPTFWIRWQYRNSDINAIKRATLQFCGVNPVRVTRIGGLKGSSDMQRQRQVARVLAHVPSASRPAPSGEVRTGSRLPERHTIDTEG